MRYYVYEITDRSGRFGHVSNAPLAADRKARLVGVFSEVDPAVDCWEALTARLRRAGPCAVQPHTVGAAE